MLDIKGLEKTYGTFQLDCTMKVESGCITGFVGQNGSGKTTTFKGILDLISYSTGAITLFGQSTHNLSVEQKEKIGVVLSDSGFSEYFTIKDIMPILSQFYKKFSPDSFEEKCKEFELPIDKKIKEFSTGMKAKLKVLIALSYEAKFLILDEPTAGLDVVVRGQVLNLLRDYMVEQPDCSILISSHISKDLEELCDNFYMIHQGSIIMEEETDRLLSSYGLLKMDEAQYEKVDKRHLLRIKKESYGISALTNEKQYYSENYPDIVIEKGSIDEFMVMMIGGEII